MNPYAALVSIIIRHILDIIPGVTLILAWLPSIRMRNTSLRMVRVVQRTNTENRKVQMGSATLYSGCNTREGYIHTHTPTTHTPTPPTYTHTHTH